MMDSQRRQGKWMAAAFLGVGAVAAFGADGDAARLSGEGARVVLAPDQPEESSPAAEAVRAPAPYGTAGTEWILVGGGAAYDFSESTDLNVNVAYSRFVADDVEWLIELGGWYHAQEGDDAGSLNPVTEFRWHFYNTGDLSLFLNAGIGVLVATDNVPFDGTGFDFTPRAGIGLTHRIGDGGSRIVAGLRWHHISNARINGDERNPSRDAPMIYVQLAMPF